MKHDTKLLVLILLLLLGTFITNSIVVTYIYLDNYGTLGGDGHGGITLIFVCYGLSIIQFLLSSIAFFNLNPAILNNKLYSFLSFNIIQFILFVLVILSGTSDFFLPLILPYTIILFITSLIFILVAGKFRKQKFIDDKENEIDKL